MGENLQNRGGGWNGVVAKHLAGDRRKYNADEHRANQWNSQLEIALSDVFERFLCRQHALWCQ